MGINAVTSEMVAGVDAFRKDDLDKPNEFIVFYDTRDKAYYYYTNTHWTDESGEERNNQTESAPLTREEAATYLRRLLLWNQGSNWKEVLDKAVELVMSYKEK